MHENSQSAPPVAQISPDLLELRERETQHIIPLLRGVKILQELAGFLQPL